MKLKNSDINHWIETHYVTPRIYFFEFLKYMQSINQCVNVNMCVIGGSYSVMRHESEQERNGSEWT